MKGFSSVRRWSVAALALLSCLALVLGLGTLKTHAVAQEFEKTLAAHYSFDTLDGYDSFAESETADFFGSPVLTEGRDAEDKAWKFDGASGMSMKEIPDLSGDFTLEVLFKVDAVPNGIGMLVAKSNYAGQTNREWALYIQNKGTAAVIIMGLWNGSWRTLESEFTVGEFHLATMQVKGTVAVLSIDGNCVGSVSFTARTATQAQLLIGHCLNGTARQQFFNGVVSDVKLYYGADDRDALGEIVPKEGLAMRHDYEFSSNSEVRDASGGGTVSSMYPSPNSNVTSASAAIRSGFVGNGADFKGASVVKTDFAIDLKKDFTLSAYIYARETRGSDRTILAQANYARGQREFALYLTTNGVLRVNFRSGNDWVSLIAGEVLPEKWYHVALTVQDGVARVYLNGYESAVIKTANVTSGTGVTLTVGGAISGTAVTQGFNGIIDEVAVYSRALSSDEVYDSILDDPRLNKQKKRDEVVADDSVNTGFEILEGTQFYCVSKSDKNSYIWQHGGAIVNYRGKFYATFGRNVGLENTPGEQCACYVSDDGRTWEFHSVLGEPVEGYGYSHGSLTEIGGKLYAFVPFYAGSDSSSSTGIRFKELKTVSFVLGEDGVWQRTALSLDNFWPVQQAEKMENGNYIVAGVDGNWRAAVAISDGEDMQSWHVVRIPYLGTAFTESNLVVEGGRVTLYMRNQSAYDKTDNKLGVAYSEDCGESWTLAQETNLSAASSKPCAGVLSTGERYLITNVSRGANGSRARLTLSLSEAGEDKFVKNYLIRDISVPDALKETYSEIAANVSLSYPYAYEFEGKLYVIYSSYMWAGTNNNNIELAIIDLSFLLSFLAAEREAEAFLAQYDIEDIAYGNGNFDAIERAYDELSAGAKKLVDEKCSAGFKIEAVRREANKQAAIEKAEKTSETIRALLATLCGDNLSQVKEDVLKAWRALTNEERAYVSAQTVGLMEAVLAIG